MLSPVLEKSTETEDMLEDKWFVRTGGKDRTIQVGSWSIEDSSFNLLYVNGH